MQTTRFFAKVYDFTGATFKRVLDAGIILNLPSIAREVNKPASEIQIDLALPWDDFGYGSTVQEGFLVRVYAVNTANPSGLLVYQGTIEQIIGSFAVGRDSVSLRLRPIETFFANALWKRSGSYVLSFAAASVESIFEDAIDDVNSIFGAPFSKNLGVTGIAITQDFQRVTHLAVMQGAAKFLPDGWFWRVRANGQIDLAQYSGTADHTLTLGLHVDSVSVTKSIIDTKNKILVSWGPTPTDAEYTDAPSEALYGRRMALISDGGIGDSGSADARGNAELARQKSPFTATQLVVNARYPIETIKPGDTVRVVNKTGGTSQMLDGIFRIQRVEYNGTVATLALDDVINNFGIEFGKSIAANQ